MDEPAEIAIPDLSDDERAMLLEMARSLRDRPARSLTARQIYDRLAQALERAAG